MTNQITTWTILVLPKHPLKTGVSCLEFELRITSTNPTGHLEESSEVRSFAKKEVDSRKAWEEAMGPKRGRSHGAAGTLNKNLFKRLFQLDDEAILYMGNAWKSPNIHPLLNWWALGFQLVTVIGPMDHVSPSISFLGKGKQLMLF